jgi:hypothetical protein
VRIGTDQTRASLVRGGDTADTPISLGAQRRWLVEADVVWHATGGRLCAVLGEAEGLSAEAVELDRLLAAGAEPLARAAAASREIARLSAVVATSLAEFARCRPAALWDRQPGERGDVGGDRRRPARRR